MHFDHLDEIYAMVKSNYQFDKVVLTGLTGLDDRSDRSTLIVHQTLTVPILSVNRSLLLRDRAGEEQHAGRRR